MDLNMFPYTEEGIAAKENKKFEKHYSSHDEEGGRDTNGRTASVKHDDYYQYTLKGISTRCQIYIYSLLKLL
jgi:hypothetical protein